MAQPLPDLRILLHQPHFADPTLPLNSRVLSHAPCHCASDICTSRFCPSPVSVVLYASLIPCPPHVPSQAFLCPLNPPVPNFLWAFQKDPPKSIFASSLHLKLSCLAPWEARHHAGGRFNTRAAASENFTLLRFSHSHPNLHPPPTPEHLMTLFDRAVWSFLRPFLVSAGSPQSPFIQLPSLVPGQRMYLPPLQTNLPGPALPLSTLGHHRLHRPWIRSCMFRLCCDSKVQSWSHQRIRNPEHGRLFPEAGMASLRPAFCPFVTFWFPVTHFLGSYIPASIRFLQPSPHTFLTAASWGRCASRPPPGFYLGISWPLCQPSSVLILITQSHVSCHYFH